MDNRSENQVTDGMTRRQFITWASELAALGIAVPFLTACQQGVANATVANDYYQRLAQRRAAEEAIRAEQLMRFNEEVKRHMPREADCQTNWHKDSLAANASLTPPRAYLEEVSKIRDPKKKFIRALQLCAVQYVKPDGTIGTSGRYDNVASCNLYAQALAQLLTYGVGNGPDVKISHFVDAQQRPICIPDIRTLTATTVRNEKDSVKINEWFEKYGAAYGWTKIDNRDKKGDERLSQALAQGKLVYGIKHNKDYYDLSHNWILFNYSSEDFPEGRTFRVNSQAYSPKFMEAMDFVNDPEVLYKFGFGNPPPGNCEVSFWSHAVV